LLLCEAALRCEARAGPPQNSLSRFPGFPLFHFSTFPCSAPIHYMILNKTRTRPFCHHRAIAASGYSQWGVTRAVAFVLRGTGVSPVGDHGRDGRATGGVSPDAAGSDCSEIPPVQRIHSIAAANLPCDRPRGTIDVADISGCIPEPHTTTPTAAQDRRGPKPLAVRKFLRRALRRRRPGPKPKSRRTKRR